MLPGGEVKTVGDLTLPHWML